VAYLLKARIVKPAETAVDRERLRTLDERPSIFIRDKPIFSSERMLYKDYYRRNSVEKTLVMGLKGLDAKTN
jgi:hypothetical protein